MRCTLLIDGDVIAYQAASACQRVVANPEEDAFGYAWAYADCKQGRAIVDNMLAKLKASLNAEHWEIALSGTSALNWRKAILPTYKSNRDDIVRPVLLGTLKQYLRDAYGAVSEVVLEADDLIGIWATGEWCSVEPFGPFAVIVGRDKDFKGIPGTHHTLGDLDGKGQPRLRFVSCEEAERFHLTQALAGDRVDGYAGCPGIGMERASQVIANPQRLVPKSGTLTAGKNKGTQVTKWYAEPTEDYWACIVSHYLKAGLTEADALTTAQVAKILLADDWSTEGVRLWSPQQITVHP